MKVIFTEHLKKRSQERGFSVSTIKKIVLKPDETYLDLREASIVAVKNRIKSGRYQKYEKNKNI